MIDNQNVYILTSLSSILDHKFVAISVKPENHETSFIVKCSETCNNVDIRFGSKITGPYVGLSLYALEIDKPRIENGIWVENVVWKNGKWVEYDDFCASKNRMACHNITTDGSQFYLTVNHNDPTAFSELTFINVDEVIPFGRRTFFTHHSY